MAKLKILYFLNLVLFIIFLTSCDKSHKYAVEITPGYYGMSFFKSVSYAIGEERTFWNCTDDVDVDEKFKFSATLSIEEISEEKYIEANGLNVIKDVTLKGKDKCYSLSLLLGLNNNLEPVDIVFKEFSGSNKNLTYIYDRINIHFSFNSTEGSNIILNIQYDKDSTYYQDLIMDSYGYDYIVITFYLHQSAYK